MDYLNCGSDPLSYQDDQSTPSYWYSSADDMSGVHYGSDAIIPCDLNQTSEWPQVEYTQESSPCSDESSIGAPSTNTSYNDNEFTDQSPENSSYPGVLFGIERRSPITQFSNIAPHVDTELLLDTRGPLASASASVLNTTAATIAAAEQYICQEGCLKKTFGRQYELERHVREQHRCQHEDCLDIRFLNPKERKDHERQHSETGLGYRCGTCVLKGIPAKTLTRGEKLKKHFKDAHSTHPKFDFRRFQCKQESCHPSKAFGGIFFTSQLGLDEHQRKEHLKPLYELSSNIREKRPSDCIDDSDAKRWKSRQPDDAMTSIASQSGGSLLGSQIELFPTLHRKKSSFLTSTEHSNGSGPRASVHSTDLPSIQIKESLPLSVVELQALTKHQSWKFLVAELESLHITPTYDSKEAAIKLSGLCSNQFEVGKNILEGLISGIRETTPGKGNPSMHTCTKTKAAFRQQVSVFPQPEIFALDPKENADTLALWNDYLLPEFPSIVRDDALIEGSYSVSLVRQEGSSGLCPIIRFRSSVNQSKPAREIIRDRVKGICAANAHTILQVQFSEGTLVRLVGESLVLSAQDDPTDDRRFPHPRRPWHTPGLSASIGPSKCPHTSATLGGYITANDRIWALTVDHFITECEPCLTHDVRSPSISDILSVKLQLRKKFQEISLRIRQSAPTEIPLGKAEDLFSGDIDEELEQYKRIESELDRSDAEFALGVVRRRCGPGSYQPLLRQSSNPFLPGTLHRMDWSLTEVKPLHRLGKNVHRYGRVSEPSLEDLKKEAIKPEGTGVPCTTVDEVVGGDAVHYIGTTSGLREGLINPALQLYADHEGVSHEWAMIVPNSARLRDCDFQGDSGAWIINNDNRLVGLLWGWDNGGLLFTPITDVFADIAESMKTHSVKLPEYSRPERPGRLCRKVVDKVSPIKIEQSFKGPCSLKDFPSYASIQEQLRRRRSSGAISAYSIDSIPSLFSSASSFTDDFNALAPPLISPPLSIRTKPVSHTSAEDIEEWVCIRPNGETIDEKLSTLRLGTDMANTRIPCPMA